MAKNQNKPRPGVVLRFDWVTTLEKMSAEAKARFLMACLHRGRDPTCEVDLDGLGDRDAVRLETLWEQAAPVIDADGQGWADGIIQRRYAGYASGCARQGAEAMSFDEYRAWYKAMGERDPGFQ